MPANILAPLNNQIGPFIKSNFDWLFFTALLLIFFGVVGIALRQRFKESKALRTTITGTGLLLTLTTYYAIYTGTLDIKPEGFAFFSIILILILIFGIMFFILQLVSKEGTAFMISYCVCYVAAWIAVHDLFDMIADNIPIVNGILAIFFVIFVVMLGIKALSHTKGNAPEIKRSSKLLDRAKGFIEKRKDQQNQVKQDINTEKGTTKKLEDKTISFSDRELKNIDDMIRDLFEIGRIIKFKRGNLDQDDIAKIKHKLRRLTKEEAVLKYGIEILPKQLRYYELQAKKARDEVRSRMEHTKDQEQRKSLYREVADHNNSLNLIENLKRYSEQMPTLKGTADNHIYAAITKLNQDQMKEVFDNFGKAKESLMQMKSLQERQISTEKALLENLKRTIKDLKHEKKSLKA